MSSLCLLKFEEEVLLSGTYNYNYYQNNIKRPNNRKLTFH